jgi:hypothetical protein
MNTLPIRFNLPNGYTFTGELMRMDKGSTTPKVFDIYEFRDGKKYNVGSLLKYSTWKVVDGQPVTDQSFWKADGVLEPFSEALGVLVEGVEWGKY